MSLFSSARHESSGWGDGFCPVLPACLPGYSCERSWPADGWQSSGTAGSPAGTGKGEERSARSTSLPPSLALLCHFAFQGAGEQGSRAWCCVFHHKMIKTTEVFLSFPVTVDVTAIAIFWDKLFISGFSSFVSCSQRKNWWGVVIIYIIVGDGDFNSDIQIRCIVLLYKRYMW